MNLIQPLTPAVIWMLVAVGIALGAGSLLRLVALRHADAELRARRLASLRTWWILAAALVVVIVTGRWGVCLAMCATSMLALREYARLVMTDPADRWGVRLAFVLAPIQYGLILLDLRLAAVLFVPLGGLILLAVARIVHDKVDHYIRATAGLTWAVMLLVYALSHAAMLVTLPEETNPGAGSIGWFLYLILLTQTNDIAQALVGRRFGAHKRHRIAPTVSPNKTWEGFWGGLVFTIALALVLAPFLTSLPGQPVRFGSLEFSVPFFWPITVGLLVAVGGFFGDLNMSAVKRDVGVKDSGQLLPGMGGMIDRIDSLTFVAPLFYYFVYGLVT